MADDEAKAEELLQEAKEQSRKDTEPAVGQDDDTPQLEDAVADAYRTIDDGELASNLTLRDENLAALFAGLEESDQLAAVGSDAAAVLDRDDVDGSNRAAVLRLLVRIGLSEVDESLIEAGKEGRKQFLESQTDEF
ncbi:hypothetical protein [Natronorubrum sp. FCH18a]|uniref:hypothetical protein n=1 Tax=Natronorubrum sp. FCH18a TaxID=3447018 RepID=UPI003F514A9F